MAVIVTVAIADSAAIAARDQWAIDPSRIGAGVTPEAK